MLELKQLQILKAGEELLSFDQVIEPGEILAVMGSSGVGKSTLLSCIIGQLNDAFTCSGRIILDGKEITELATENRQIGMMFQSPLLFPHMTVMENIKFGAPNMSASNVRNLDEMLESVGLTGLSKRMPSSLSGGQQSRVALLRLLVSKPKAVLLDEPFSSLDKNNKANTRDFIVEHLRNAKVPVILVTHDEEDANAIQSRIVRLDGKC